MTKICTTCATEKELSKFHRDKRTNDGRCYRCKECAKLYHISWYAENRDKALGNSNSWKRKNREKVKLQNKEWKKNNPDKWAAIRRRCAEKKRRKWWAIVKAEFGDLSCSVCGFNTHSAALDLHHKTPDMKEIDVSKLMNLAPTPERISMLKDTIMLCSNCHRILHHKDSVNFIK